MSESKDIKHVSDTALWVATYRAEETKRGDALFKDPLAISLVGERGPQIAATMPFPRIMHWVLVVRTVAIDKLIHQAIEQGVDTVINLGAGLDTRPYRMNLPSNLNWVEIDFPHMIAFKTEKLADQNPVCRLHRVGVDLGNDNARRQIFSELGSDSKKALIITEGVVPYLTNEQAGQLAKDLLSVPTFYFWIHDYRERGLKNWAPKKLIKKLKDAPIRFDSPQYKQFFCDTGWRVFQDISASSIAREINRPFPIPFPWNFLFKLLPQSKRKSWSSLSGYVMFKRGTN